MPYTLEQLQQNDYYQKLKDADRDIKYENGNH